MRLFTLDRVKKSGAKFDPEKTKWFNHKYLVAKPDAELADLVDEMLKAEQIVFDRKKTEKICSLMKERYNFVADLYADCRFFLVTPT